MNDIKRNNVLLIIVTIAVICMISLMVGIYNLNGEVNRLNTDYSSMSSKYYSEKDRSNVLQNELNGLNNKYNTLQSNYNSLKSGYDILQSKYDNLQGQSFTIKSNYQNLESENKRITSLLNQYEKVPSGYYSSNSFKKHDNTNIELRKFLSTEFKLPTNYQLDVFDCSEMSSYLQWALTNAGFNANIVSGKTPWSPDTGYHAWVIVKFNDGVEQAIESTAITDNSLLNILAGNFAIVTSTHPGYSNYYYGYNERYESIYFAIKHNSNYQGISNQWNWWEGYWGFI